MIYIDWKVKLFQVLYTFGEMEGTWYDDYWKGNGISDEEKEIIEDEYREWLEAISGTENE